MAIVLFKSGDPVSAKSHLSRAQQLGLPKSEQAAADDLAAEIDYKIQVEQQEAADRQMAEAANQAAAIEEERRQAAAKEAEANVAREKARAAMSPLQGHWVHIKGNVTVDLSLYIQSDKLTGSMTKNKHIDARSLPGSCTDSILWGSLKQNCKPGPTIPEKDYTNYSVIEGQSDDYGQITIAGKYQRCVGDCRSVSNPDSLDISSDTAELRDRNELYWDGMQFKRQ